MQSIAKYIAHVGHIVRCSYLVATLCMPTTVHESSTTSLGTAAISCLSQTSACELQVQNLSPGAAFAMCVVNAASPSDPCVDGPGLVPLCLQFVHIVIHGCSSISLSTDLQNLDSVDMYIGFANSACSWSLAGQLATGFISTGRFKVNRGFCCCFKWVTTEEELPIVQIPTISLARPLLYTVVLSRVHMAFFDAEDLWQVPAGANTLRAFVALASGDDSMPPLSDTSTVVADLATTTDGVWLAKKLALLPTNSSMNRCCAQEVFVADQDIGGGASVLVEPERPALPL